jgi:hypothetical protein
MLLAADINALKFDLSIMKFMVVSFSITSEYDDLIWLRKSSASINLSLVSFFRISSSSFIASSFEFACIKVSIYPIGECTPGGGWDEVGKGSLLGRAY